MKRVDFASFSSHRGRGYDQHERWGSRLLMGSLKFSSSLLSKAASFSSFPKESGHALATASAADEAQTSTKKIKGKKGKRRGLSPY
jgi:hypothetical protein